MNDVLDEQLLSALLDRFYTAVRADELLGPVFDAAVADWPAHMTRLRDFWSSVMLTSGRYKGHPVAMHAAMAAHIEPAMFGRWLRLWGEATDGMLPPPCAAAMHAKAERIAESLQLALALRTPGGQAAMLGSHTAEPALPVDPTFDRDTLPAALGRAHSAKGGNKGC